MHIIYISISIDLIYVCTWVCVCIELLLCTEHCLYRDTFYMWGMMYCSADACCKSPMRMSHSLCLGINMLNCVKCINVYNSMPITSMSSSFIVSKYWKGKKTLNQLETITTTMSFRSRLRRCIDRLWMNQHQSRIYWVKKSKY